MKGTSRNGSNQTFIKLLCSLVIVSVIFIGMIRCDSSGTIITDLTVNYVENPIGIERNHVLFGWKMASNLIGQAQTAYQISVKEANGNEIWNSGLVAGNLSVAIPYAGPELALEMRYNWTVTVTCADGSVITSESAYFETGTDFSDAEWITYQPPVENYFDNTMNVSVRATIIENGFTLVFGIKNENNRFVWSFTENTLTASKSNPGGSVQLAFVDLSSVVTPDVPFDLEIIVTDSTVTTLIDGQQTSTINHNYVIERPYIGVMASGAVMNRITQELISPAQSAMFENLTLTVDGVSERIGDPSFTLAAPETDQSQGQGGFPGMGGSGGGGAIFIQTEYQGQSVEYLEESTAMPMLRTEAPLKGDVESARLYITALGIYDAYINGQEVMLIKDDGSVLDDAFSPGWTNYNDYLYYRTYDVTPYLTAQSVALGVQIGTGWYAGHIGRQYYAGIGEEGINEIALLAKLVVHYTDGSRDVIVSNTEDWLASEEGPILMNDFFYGEVYDARLEAGIEGWNNAGFDDSGWGQVSVLDYEPELVAGFDNAAYMLEEDRIYPQESDKTFIYDPENIDFSTELEYGAIVPTIVNPTREIALKTGNTLIIDMGQNFAGVASISVSGAEGTEIKLRGAEMLNDGKDNPTQQNGGSCGPRGTLYWYGLTRGRESDETWYTDTYYLNDQDIQEYRASFTFHGYQYLEVTADDDIVIHSVYGQPITSAVTQTGFIETNNENVNRLFSNTLWSQMGNYLSIPTDCPNRSERLGWSGDVNVFSETALYNFDVVTFLDNYMNISDNYAENNGGYFGTTMPGPSRGQGSSNAGWTDVAIILAWDLYLQTGDKAILERTYDMLSDYMALITENGLSPGYGDWVAFQSTSNVFMAVLYQAYDALLMSKIATVLDLTGDVNKYKTEYDRLREEIYAKYVDDEGNVLSMSADPGRGRGFMQDDNVITDNSQTGILWALKLGLHNSTEEKQIFINHLLTNINNDGGQIRPNSAEKTLSTGFLGVNVLLPVLTENGLTKTAYDLLLQDEMPSWLYEVKNGATTTWERWDGYSAENSFGDYGMNSFNHYAYGAVGEWMFEYMAGIQKDEKKTGFKNIILQPTLDTGSRYNDQPRIREVKGRYDSYYGPIVSSWTSDNGQLATYEAVVPANTTATLYLPLDNALTEASLNDFENISGVTYKGIAQHNGMDAAEFELLAGGYVFEVSSGKLVARLQEGYVALQ
ncbi:family 78 glycoside hydrolase catalytic domain [bacterium]|nr:family 78 glycoside hydrolase catalytic domain [bacterium]